MSLLKAKREEYAVALSAVQNHSVKINAADYSPSDDDIKEGEKLFTEAEKLKNQVSAIENFSTSSDSLIKEASASRGRKVDVNGNLGAPVVEAVRDRIKDDPKLGFSSFGEFANEVRSACVPGQMASEKLKIAAAASGMNQASGPEGGYTLPPEFNTTIWNGLYTDPDSLLARTDTYTVQGESLTFNANAETSRATGSRYGGVQGYWLAEAAQMTGSKPTFRQVKVEPHQLAVLVYVTDKLLNNSPVALDQYLTKAAGDEINFLVGDAIVNGNGSGKPLGILNSAARVTIAKESGQTNTTVVKANIDKMWARLNARSRSNAVWFINQDVEPQLQALVQLVGTTGGVPAYLPPGGLSGAPYGALYGKPVVPIEYCATLGTEGDIILADMKGYLTGTRGGVANAMSMHLRFDYNETAFRFLFAVDGQTWMKAALTPFKGSATQSSFITIAGRP